MIEIRQATREDAVALAAIGLRCALSLAPDCTRDGLRTLLRTLVAREVEQRLCMPSFETWLALLDGRPAGFCVMRDHDHLLHFFVDPGFRGQGVAGAMWRSISTSRECVTLNASSNAVPVYRHFGFRETAARQSMSGVSYQPMRWIRPGGAAA